MKFVFITPCFEEEFFDTVKKGAHDAAALLGLDCTFSGTEEVDIDRQIRIMQDAIDAKYDGIVLSITHPTAFDDVIERSLAENVPVIAFNVNARGRADDGLTEVCQDVYSAGKKLAAELENRISENGRILFTMHSEGISALEDRYNGLVETLAEKDIVPTRLITGIDPRKAAGSIAAFLKDNSDIKTVIGTGQADTEGAGLAVEEFFATGDYLVAGFDLSQEILRLISAGVIACTVDQQPYVQGFYPVLQLSQLCRYGLKPMNIDSGAVLVTNENVAAVSELCQQGYR